MTAISAFVYTIQKSRKIDASPSVKEVKVSLAFGDGAKTYPTGGIPILKASLGLPNNLESLQIVDSGHADGYVYKWDEVNNKILLYVTADTTMATVAAPLAQLANTATPAASTITVIARGY